MTSAELVRAHWEAQKGSHLETRCVHLSDHDLEPWLLVHFVRADGSQRKLFYYCCAACEVRLR